MKKPPSRFLVRCAGFAVVGLLAGCDRSAGAGARPSTSVPNVQIVHLKTGEITRRLTLPGNLRAYQETVLYAKVPGYLKSIAVDRGDWVKAGDALAEIEAPEMLADVARFKAEAHVAELESRRVNAAIKKAPDLVMPLTVDAARGKYEIAKANLERIETLLGYSKIVAPFDGVVTRRWVDVGAFIPAATSSSAARNAAVVTMMDISRVRIEVAIPEPEAPLVKNDLPVEVTVEELRGRVFAGTITRFAYALDEATKTMTAEIEVPNTDHALRPGMYASCQVALEQKTGAQLLPAEALVTEKNRGFVFAYRDGKAARLPVKTGFDDGISVEILEGLKPNEAVIVAGRQAVTDGEIVNATEAR
ncbi:MAG: efflux RND transporter periplasmic adaptor subunit [Limisphaerales bacterium]